VKHLVIEDMHNSWLCCFTNPLELGAHVSDMWHIQLTMGKRNTCSKFKRICETI